MVCVMSDDLLLLIACYLALLVDRVSFSRSHRRFATLLRPMIAGAKERPAAAAAALGCSHLKECVSLGRFRQAPRVVIHEAPVAETLKFNKVLTSLSLRFNRIKQDGATAIGNALACNAVLTELKLVYNRLDLKGTKAIASALKVNIVLTKFQICGPMSGSGDVDEGVLAITEALKVNKVLSELHFKSYAIGDPSLGTFSAIFIGDLLKVNKCITKLRLVACGIACAGATAVAEALKVNSVLTELYLYGNNIANKGASSIADALMVNKVLTVLALDANEIGGKGAAAIAEGLKVNSTLISLNLDCNKIQRSGKAFRQALETNSSLKVLEMFSCDLSHTDIRRLSCGMALNMSVTALDLSYNGRYRAIWISLILQCPSLRQACPALLPTVSSVEAESVILY